MLEKYFNQIYTNFKLRFYSVVFQNFEQREATLSAVEVFCVEVIYALDKPTILEFANFAKLSPPNATYKINCLIKKGYIEKIQSDSDRRKYSLVVTQKFLDYCGITYDYSEIVMKRIRARFSEEEVEKFESMLQVIATELMPEVTKK